jgi:pimeloyl-ACP methyl ester carboxylesterase
MPSERVKVVREELVLTDGTLVVTEGVHLPRTHTDTPSGGEEVHVVVVPGNPGNVHFYSAFLQGVYAQCDGEASVHGLSLAGFRGKSQNGGKKNTNTGQLRHKASIQDQVEVLAAFMRAVQANSSADRVRFVLMGHSIGAWLCVQVLLRYVYICVCMCVCVFLGMCASL